jgi:hypothetical protein
LQRNGLRLGYAGGGARSSIDDQRRSADRDLWNNYSYRLNVRPETDVMRPYAPPPLLASVCFGQATTNLTGTAINTTNPDSPIAPRL